MQVCALPRRGVVSAQASGVMNVFLLRRRVGVLLVLSGVVLAVSYAYAGYLLYRRSHPWEPATAMAARVEPGDGLAAADTYLRKKKVEQALVAYREVLSRDPHSVRAQLGVAEGELLAGREAVASREYERVLRLDAGHPAALLQLARMYSHQASTWPRAETRYKQYLAIRPHDAEALLGLARVLAWQGKPEGAASLFARPEVAQRMTITDQRDYAFALVKLGRWNQAEPLLEKLIASRPGDDELLLQLAGIHAGRRDWDAALPLYHSLLARRPHDPELNMSYGLGLLATRNYRAALGPLEKARDAMPGRAEAGLAYARALKGSGDLKKAVREYERVLPKLGWGAEVTREYADVLLEKRDYRKSAKYYRAVYDAGLRDDRLLRGLAGALAGDGKYKAALPVLEDLHARAPTPRVKFELARALAKTGRHEQARELLRELGAGPSVAVARR